MPWLCVNLICLSVAVYVARWVSHVESTFGFFAGLLSLLIASCAAYLLAEFIRMKISEKFDE